MSDQWVDFIRTHPESHHCRQQIKYLKGDKRPTRVQDFLGRGFPRAQDFGRRRLGGDGGHRLSVYTKTAAGTVNTSMQALQPASPNVSSPGLLGRKSCRKLKGADYSQDIVCTVNQCAVRRMPSIIFSATGLP